MGSAHIPEALSWRAPREPQFDPLAGFYTLFFKSMVALSVCEHWGRTLGSSTQEFMGAKGWRSCQRHPGSRDVAEGANGIRCLLARLLHFLASLPHPPSLGDVGNMLLWGFKGFGSGGSVKGKIKPEVSFSSGVS